MFRTQGGDFGFPYKQDESKIQGAKAKAAQLFYENAWDRQIHPLSWLIEKFWPILPFWTEADLAKIKEKDHLFYERHPELKN